LFIASMFITGATIASADPVTARLTTADDSELSQFCIAAVSAPEGVVTVAQEYGIAPAEIGSILCNGKPLASFVRLYRPVTDSKTIAYTLNEADDSMATKLCLAAISSEETFREIREDYFYDVRDVNSEILCNGMQLDRFVAKYRNSRLTAAL
jgi:hypothetical protein